MIGESTYHATARLENGQAAIKVTAVTPYGDRTVSTSIEITDEALLAKAAKLMEAAVKSATDELQKQAFKEAARAVTVALENEEAI